MRPPTVLVVDDAAPNLAAMAGQLEGTGLDVVVAQDGEEAIERAGFVRPSLILLDVVMPGVDGFETCRRLKAREDTRDIPVIFMTSLNETADKVTGFALGAVDYVTKPLDGAEVIARVRTHLAMSELRRELARQNAQLGEEVAAHERTQAALRRSNQELEQLAYVASHDMQEPLRMIASYLQLVAERFEDRLDADGREFIGFAVDGAKRMQALINDMLAYSRVGTKARPRLPTDCEAVLETALGHLQVAIAESRARISRSPLPTVPADGTQLVQVFQNLLANAVKFRTDAPPCIHVGCEAREQEWLFSVADNGIGISPEYAERIFVLFQRLHGRSKYPGTGIGLALCKRIVESHGGRIWVEAAKGGGSVFKFTLPREAAAQ
jgi:signal transduction histidine kinase